MRLRKALLMDISNDIQMENQISPVCECVCCDRVGEQVKTMVKAKMSAYAGPIDEFFSPYHVSFSFTNIHEISDSVIKDKVGFETI